jgi:mono/diheme cytochrome c family protein
MYFWYPTLSKTFLMKKTAIITALSIFAASFFVSFTQDKILKESMERGKEVYSLYCQNCHMENGQGMEGVNPPLAKTTYLKDTKKNIGIILNGQTGEVVVNGKKYNAIMLPLNYLDDKQVADVLNYARNSWGNKYPIVTPAQVKAERK